MARDDETCVSSSRCAYQVFLSFRGADTRKNFTDHLYHVLKREGVHTYRDDEEIVRGEAIKCELEKAIKQSKVFVIVISENHASSSWCLDELVMIMEKKRATQNTVLPVFYRVDPADIRWHQVTFVKSFVKHEKRLENEKDKIEKHEADFIQDIVRETTVAKTVYNHNVERFDGGSFLADIRDAAKETSSLIRIQKKLLSDILKRPVEGTKSVKGITLDFSWLKADQSEEGNVDADTFRKLQNVKLLNLNYGNVIGNLKNFPKNLIWLCWNGFSSE
ncbi:disease resistance protein RPV1-like [Rutidosis leptorrhynchoides]|uniref:disease resistance protein RPV1-like n=1 Tax=Rutidosis leptorrhynchoides TaxID=125765 RepID=UPI003A98FF2B